MKKSLSLVVSSALVFSLFSSVAFAADATTTSTAPTTQEMMKDLGFSGTDHDYLDRASAAVSILKGLGIEVDNTATLSFTDVNASDAWAPYIATAAKLGIVHGVDATHFQPFEKVSQQDYAIMLTLGYAAKTGQKVDTTATTDVNAADYAKPYIKAAIDLGLLDASTDWSGTAGYDWMVKGAYNAKVAVTAAQAPATIGVAKFEATGAKQFTVTFDGAVDATKAKLALQRNGIDVSDVTPKFADDGKSATLTLNTKINEATYSVTLSGIDNLNADKATASVATQNESIKSIDITTASDTLPLANAVKVEFVAKNQYGEKSDLSASSFTFSTGGATYRQVSGEQAITLDLVGADAANPDYAKGDKVPVTIIYSDSNGTAQTNKIFTVGEAPIVSKIELGDLLDSDGNKVDSVEAGKTAYLDVKAYDQYGVRVSDKATLNDSGKGITVVIPDNELVKGDDPTDTSNPAFVDNIVGDSAADLAVSAKSDASAKDITVTMFANGSGQSVSKVIHVATPSVPATVDFGAFTDTLAKGDADKYIPLVVKDASGKTLTPQQIADNADKFTVYAIGGVVSLAADDADNTNAIRTTGADKGKVHISAANYKGNGQIVIQLKDDPTQKATFNVTVNPDRVADHIGLSEAAASKLVYINGVGATDEFKIKTFDQYNGDFKQGGYDSSTPVATRTANDVDAYVRLKLEKVSGDATATITGVPNNSFTTTNATDDTPVYDTLSIPGGSTSVTRDVYDTADLFDHGMNWSVGASGKGTFKLTATLIKRGTPDVELSSTTSKIDISDGKDLNLTYSVSLDKVTDNTLIGTNKIGLTVSDIGALSARGDYVKSVKLTAKDSNGNEVAVPNVIASVSSSNRSIVDFAVNTTDHTATVAGINDGTANINVLAYTPGGGMSSANLSLTVKADRPSIVSIASDKSNNSIDQSVLTAGYIANPTTDTNWMNVWDDGLMNKLTFTDQYGNEFTNDTTDEATTYDLGISYYVSDVKHKSAGSDDVVHVNPNGKISIQQVGTADIASFVLHAISPSGKEATCEITIN